MTAKQSRGSLRQQLRTWHNWCGLLLAVLLLLIALSGSLMVFKSGLIRTLVTDGHALPVHYSVAQVAQELDRINQRFPAPALDLLKAPNPQDPYWTVNTDTGDIILLAPLSLEPYTRNLWLLPTLDFIRHLHTELFAGLAGELILFVTGVGALFLLGSGFYLWWPARRSFRWRWVLPRKAVSSTLIMFHRHGGVVLLLAILPVVSTGSVMLFLKLETALSAPAETVAPQPTASPYLPSELLLTAAASIPDGWPTYIRVPPDEPSIRFRLPGEWHSNGRSSVTVNPLRNDISAYSRADQATPMRRFLNQMYPLHSGFGLSALYSCLVFLAGSGLLWLCYTGVLSWYSRRQMRLRSVRNAAAGAAAPATAVRAGVNPRTLPGRLSEPRKTAAPATSSSR